MAKLLKSEQSPDIIRLADNDALIAVAGQADMAGLIAATEDAQKDPQLKKMAKAAGVDLNKQMLEQLSGAVGAIVYLAPDADIIAALKRPPRNASATGALLARVLRFELMAGLKQKDDLGAGKMLGLFDAYFAKQGLSPETRRLQKTEIHSIELAHGDQPSHPVHYAAANGKMLLGTGDAAMFDKVLLRTLGGDAGDLKKTMGSASARLLQKKGNALFYLSFSNLIERLRALADNPEFKQPSLRTAALRSADYLHAFKSVALRVSKADDGIHVTAMLEISPAASDDKK